MDRETRRALAQFAKRAPYFTEMDWLDYPPEWRAIYNAAVDLRYTRPRRDRSGKMLPGRLLITLLDAITIIVQALSLKENHDPKNHNPG
jgi:hypothetical protein